MNQKPPSPQIAPGTQSRPILSSTEASLLSQEHYFAQAGLLAKPTLTPWQPEPIAQHHAADFTVGVGGSQASVQAAINAAIRSGKRTRQFIKILPGTYIGAVYVPIDAPPLSLIGAGQTPAEVKLELTLDAIMLPAEYARSVNPDAQFQPGDPAWDMFKVCAELPGSKKIDTPCSAVMWVQSTGFQIANLTITNTLLDTVDGGTHQAVALRTDGDQAQLENVRLVGRQDTFLVNAGEAPTFANKLGTYATEHIARAYIKDCYIEGDTDFVFGRAQAVFERCEFHIVASRQSRAAIVFAPDTLAQSSLGFLVLNSRFTGDARHQAGRNNFLGRSWDQGALISGYQIGSTPNGQLLIRDSYIDASFSASHPWDRAATTNRPHAGNADPARELNDAAFNRLWEFNNYGPGAGVLPAP